MISVWYFKFFLFIAHALSVPQYRNGAVHAVLRINNVHLLMKILRFAMGVTRKDKIRNEHIRSTVKAERLGNEDERGQAEVVWTCHEKRPRVCRKKDDGKELPGKRRGGRPKRRFLDVVKEDMREFGAKETDVEDRKVWRKMIRCGHPCLKGKAERIRRRSFIALQKNYNAFLCSLLLSLLLSNSHIIT